ncbi:MAG: transposase [Gammaproteobacteria bacterium]|nr:transposase [Gammaproteobacteria bacterium]
MPQARYRLVDTETTPYYHCMSRCVRRAFLCGKDSFTGKNFDHRKQWILDRVKQLSSVFAIEVCAYAIMSNHFHLVLHVDTESAKAWTDDEVIERWLMLYKGPELANKYKAGEALDSIELDALTTLTQIWRTRLANLSWYMRCLNEVIARMANEEDNCTGRFWEGRFKSQALLNEAALISCMAYVDLNPVRAGMSDTLESSEFTSIQERLQAVSRSKSINRDLWLKPLEQEEGLPSLKVLPIQETDYFTLVDWTGRAIRDDKRGAIPKHVQPILQRLGVNEANWVTNTQHFGSRFYRALGRVNQIRKLAMAADQNWIQGLSSARHFYQ